MSKKANYDLSIDSLKGLAIIGVVAMHIPISGIATAPALSVLRSFQALMEWCVLAFFYAAGYLQANQSRSFGLRSWVEYSGSRVWRLLVPCVIFSVFNKVILYALWRMGLVQVLSHAVPDSAWESVLFIAEPCSPQFYFLQFLFVIQVLTWPLLRFSKLVVAILALLAIVVSINGVRGALHPWLHGSDPHLLPVYFICYLVGAYSSGKNDRELLIPLAVSCLCVLVCALLLRVGASKLLLVAVPPLLHRGFRCSESGFPARNFGLLGKHSAAIFIWHAPILISVVSMVGVRLMGRGWASVLFTLVVTLAGAAWLGGQIRRFKCFGPLRY